MSVVRVHPEHLIERLFDGTIAPAERESLDRHLDECHACRLELMLRDDLSVDAAKLDQSRLSLLVAETLTLASTSEAPSRASTRRRVARGRRRLGVALAGALVFAAGAAAAQSGFVERVKRAAAEVFRAKPRDAAELEAGASGMSQRAAHAETSVAAVPSVDAAVLSQAPSTEPDEAQGPTDEPTGESSEVRGAGGTAADSSRAYARSEHARGMGSDSEHEHSKAAALFAEANAARLAGRRDASALYEQLQREFPSSPEAKLSHAVLARIHLDRGSAAAALEGFDAYIAGGGGALGEDALAGRALAFEKLGRLDDERAAWAQLLEHYPRSGYATMARRRLAARPKLDGSRAGDSASTDDPL